MYQRAHVETLTDLVAQAKLGANAILGVSLALSKAGAAAAGVPLYQVGSALRLL